MLGITDLRVGATAQINGEPFVVVWSQMSKQARGGGIMKTKMRNLLTGNIQEITFHGADKIEPAEINFRPAQFLYSTPEGYEFMDQESYEQINFEKKRLGEMVHFLKDGTDVDIQYFDGQAINVQLKPKMAFEITETEPGVRGDTAGNVTKNAKIETGYELKVPAFVNKGDKIIINTTTGEYVERAK